MSEQTRKALPLPPTTPADISVFEDRGTYVLRNQDGQAMYQYDLDVDGRSHCTGICASIWPPVLASIGASAVVGEWKIIQRGTDRQWSYRGKPVYIYSKDAPGDTKGDGVDGKWHLLKI
jgi:predicted lipoprotein with Yx(FWY)xxD motif